MKEKDRFPFLAETLYTLISERDMVEDCCDARPIAFERPLDRGKASLESLKNYQQCLGDKFGKTWIARLLPLDPGIFTIIAVIEDTGQAVMEYVRAATVEEAAYLLAQDRPELTFVAAMPGKLVDGSDIHFFGEGMVDAITLLDTGIGMPTWCNR